MKNNNEKVTKDNKTVNYIVDALNSYGVQYIAEEFDLIIRQYNELAAAVTKGRYNQNWTHKDVLRGAAVGDMRKNEDQVDEK